jgi:hypothetical protein
MSINDSANRAHAETKGQDGAPDVLPLGPLMKTTMIEWYEYHVRLSGPADVGPSEPDHLGLSETDDVGLSEPDHVGPSETDHVCPSETVNVSIAVALADIMAENRHAKFYREEGVSAFGIISVPFLKDIVHWVRIGDEIKLISGDFGPAQCGFHLCRAVLAEFFRDIRETEPELPSIFARPLPKWIKIYWKGRAECTGRLPDMAEDSIH